MEAEILKEALELSSDSKNTFCGQPRRFGAFPDDRRFRCLESISLAALCANEGVADKETGASSSA